MFSFIKNSSNNRVFCDAMIRLIAIEIILSGSIDADQTVPSYKKFDAEFKTGKHGGYSFIEVSEKISAKDLEKLNDIIKEGSEYNFENINKLREYLTEKLHVTDDFLHPLNEPNNFEHTFNIAANKRKQLKNEYA